MFDYEKLILDSLLIPDFYNPLQHTFKEKHLRVKKATRLGVTEFFLRARLRYYRISQGEKREERAKYNRLKAYLSVIECVNEVS